MITGINHLTLSVHDLDISFQFYRNVLNAKPIAKWDRGAYLTLGDVWLCLTVDKYTRLQTLAEYTHIAFNVAQVDFSTVAEQVKQAGVDIWQENTSEGDSLYFLDPNGHKLELHATSLADRIATTKATPYAGMVFYV